LWRAGKETSLDEKPDSPLGIGKAAGMKLVIGITTYGISIYKIRGRNEGWASSTAGVEDGALKLLGMV